MSKLLGYVTFWSQSSQQNKIVNKIKLQIATNIITSFVSKTDSLHYKQLYLNIQDFNDLTESSDYHVRTFPFSLFQALKAKKTFVFIWREQLSHVEANLY